jgi:cysteine-rich protein 2-binding protein
MSMKRDRNETWQRRLASKRMLRDKKRQRGMTLFDIDATVHSAMIPFVSAPRQPLLSLFSKEELIGRKNENGNKREREREREKEKENEEREESAAARPSAFDAVLGRVGARHARYSSEAMVSPYTRQVLPAYVWRNVDVRAPRMMLMQHIKRAARQRLQRLFGVSLQFDDDDDDDAFASIDFCFLQAAFVRRVNSLLAGEFWPGIDVADALVCPDYTVVALCKQLVVGAAFVTPSGYITYIAVRPDWQGLGIGRFMLYRLIESVPRQLDITLHVSATNPAMMLYQRFGFKPEQFLRNFYDRYLPPNSNECKHAFYLRLRRR